MFGFAPFSGDPDVTSSAGPTATGVFPAPSAALPTPVTAGLWAAVPSELGPYSSPGDFWEFAASPLAASAGRCTWTTSWT